VTIVLGVALVTLLASGGGFAAQREGWTVAYAGDAVLQQTSQADAQCEPVGPAVAPGRYGEFICAVVDASGQQYALAMTPLTHTTYRQLNPSKPRPGSSPTSTAPGWVTRIIAINQQTDEIELVDEGDWKLTGDPGLSGWKVGDKATIEPGHFYSVTDLTAKQSLTGSFKGFGAYTPSGSQTTTTTKPSPALATASGVTVTGVTGYGFVAPKPLALSGKQLAALQQATENATIDGKTVIVVGPPVAEVLGKAGFTGLRSCDDDDLRYWIEASNKSGDAAVIAGGELTSDGPTRLPMLALTVNGKVLPAPQLVIAGDRTSARDVRSVSTLTVGRAAPQLASSETGCNPKGFKAPVTAPAAGSVVINGAVAKPATLTLDQLQAMKQVQQGVSYTSGGSPRSRSEQGPSLYAVLKAADPKFGSSAKERLRYYLEVTSSKDGSAVVVSWAEVDPSLDATQALLSLVEDGESVLTQDPGPRLTMPGDVAGARYDYGVQVVTLFRAP
jgi:hypothetical protein